MTILLMSFTLKRNENSGQFEVVGGHRNAEVDQSRSATVGLTISGVLLASLSVGLFFVLKPREPPVAVAAPQVAPPDTQTPTPTAPVAPPKPKYTDDDIGILLGDSVVRGFGSGPVYYNVRSAGFSPRAYRFMPRMDKPINSLRGYKGLRYWLNRGVTGNPSNAALARWDIDVMRPQDRGFQKKRFRVRSIVVSTGFTDIAAATGTRSLAWTEENLRKNCRSLVKKAYAHGIHIAFLQIPDPLVAPLGENFHTLAGTPVLSFCEEQQYGPATRKQFIQSVQRFRKFLDTEIREMGAEIIDYASFLPPEYFWDSHHPSIPGYVELGRLLREREANGEDAP